MSRWTNKPSASTLRQRLSAFSFCVAATAFVPGCDLEEACDLVEDGDSGDHQRITEAEVLAAQKSWGDGIVAIGKAYAQKGDYVKVAEDHIDTLYAYDLGEVLFKPTKAADQQFRLTREDALSYFVKGVVPEDGGFALQPWSKVRFENAGIIIGKKHATAMGNYYFTDANTGEETKVEYTFGYRRHFTGELVINVHHSSLPYSK